MNIYLKLLAAIIVIGSGMVAVGLSNPSLNQLVFDIQLMKFLLIFITVHLVMKA